MFCLLNGAYFSPDSDKTALFVSLEKAILWIEDSYFSRTQVKYILTMDLLLTNRCSPHDVN